MNNKRKVKFFVDKYGSTYDFEKLEKKINSFIEENN